MPLTCPVQQLFQTGGGVGFGAARYSRPDGECFVVTLEPGQEGRLFGSWKALQVQPVVIGTHVGIDQGAERIEFENFVACGGNFVHGFLALSRGEADQKSERWGATEGFAGPPLRDSGAETLRAGAFT